MKYKFRIKGMSCSACSNSIEKVVRKIEGIKQASPNTLIIVQSIPPVSSYYDSRTTGINNDKINKLNYYILEMCSELNIPFLNSAEALKDENGVLKKALLNRSAFS